MIMTNLAETLRSIVSGNENVCCLCFNICESDDLVFCEDEANINNNDEKNVLTDIIEAVLGRDLLQYVKTMNIICRTCVIFLESSYTYIQTCKANASLLSNMVTKLDSTVQNVIKPDKTSLYVSINLENLATFVLYDNKKVHSQKQAAEQYKIISSPKEEPQKVICNIFRCPKCDRVFKSMSNLRTHFTKVHTSQSYKCSKCPKSFKSIARVNAHNIYTHKTKTCEECGKIYNNIKAWKAHQLCHNTSLVCADCGRTYKNKATFKNHINLNICKQGSRHSPTDAKYTCDYCNKKYTQKISLKIHIQFEHGNYKGHICEWCGKKFWAQSRLKAHIVKHTRERNFTCSICNKKFVTKESLLYHTRLHTGEKPYKCSECSSTFLSASRRSDHFKRHHVGAKPDLKCDVCKGKFRSSNALVKHKKTHEENINNPIQKLYTLPRKDIDKYIMLNIQKEIVP